MSAALLLLLLAAPAPPDIPVKTGAPIRLDGRLEEAEWADAFSVTGERPSGGKLRLAFKRTGPWLALGVEAEKAYRGEVLRLNVTDRTGAWVTNVVLGLGQPVLPPAVWRRGPAERFDDTSFGAGESPRACLVRLDVGGPDRWSAEALLRLGALGIGKGDVRDLRGLFEVYVHDPEPREVLTLPEGAKDPHDPAQYGRLVSPDAWGAAETWAPVTPEQSKEFDDAELLRRLGLEEAGALEREPQELVIANAVAPRSMGRVDSLRRQIEEGRARNPTLPAWTYFLGQLLNRANLYDDAWKAVESIPKPLRSLGPFATLAAEHFLNTERFAEAEQVCRACPYISAYERLLDLAVKGQQAQEAERAAVAKDEAKQDKNPRVRFRTSKGDFVVELFEDDAPGTVRNFMDLVLRRRFYDGLRFHQVQGARVAVVGDPRTRLGTAETKAGPGFRIRPDPPSRALLRGYLVAQPLADRTFHGSQFFLALAPMISEKDRTYSFGRVVEGLDVLLKLEQDDLLERVEVVSQRNHSYDPAGVRMDR